MNTRAFTLALVIASIAMFMVYTFIDEEQNFKTKFGREVPVVIAKVDIQELELIDDSKLQKFQCLVLLSISMLLTPGKN